VGEEEGDYYGMEERKVKLRFFGVSDILILPK